MNFTARKCRAAGSTTRLTRRAISVSAEIRRHTFATSKPSAGPKNKTGNAPGRPGWHFMPLSRRRSRSNDRHLFRDCGLGGGEARDWNSEWTATDVITPELVETFQAVGFAGVIAADS